MYAIHDLGRSISNLLIFMVAECKSPISSAITNLPSRENTTRTCCTLWRARIALATVCCVEWNVYTAAFTPPKWCNCAYGFCTHESLLTKFWNLYEKFTLVGLWFTKNAREVSSSGKGDFGFIIHTKLMLAHSASRFMQQIGKKRTRLQCQHTNFVCFDAYKAKYVHTAIHDF